MRRYIIKKFFKENKRFVVFSKEGYFYFSTKYKCIVFPKGLSLTNKTTGCDVIILNNEITALGKIIKSSKGK